MKNIIKNKKVEIEFENNNKLWQITLDAMSESVFLIDSDHKILQCNKATLDIWGKSNYNEIIGHSCWELVHGTPEPVDWCPVKRMRETGQRETIVQMINDRYVEISVDPVFNDAGEIIGVVHITTDISARKQTEDALSESEQQYHTILNSLNDPMHVVDKELKIIYQNPAMAKWLDKLNMDSDLIGKNIFEKFPFLDYDTINNEYSKVFKTGETLVAREITDLSNRNVFSETLKIPIRSGGKVNQIITIIRDITEQKEAKVKYQQLFNKSPNSISLFDLDGNIVDCNNATSNLLSTHTLKDYNGKNYREFWTYHEKDKPLIALFNNKFTEIIKTGKTLNFEFPIHRTIGRIIWCYATASKIKIGKKEFIQLILIDISAQKKAQQRLKESEEKFRNLSNELETILDIIPGLLFCKDKNGVITRTNHLFAESLNFTKECIIGKTAFDLFPKDQAESFQKDDLEVINSGKPKLNIEESADFADGKIWVITNKIPYNDEEGNVSGIIGLAVDITERKKIEQELKESEEKFRTMAEQSFMGIIILQDGLFKYFNEQAAKINGYTIEEIQNWEPYEFKKLIHPDDRDFVMKQVRKKESGDPNIVIHYQYRLIKKNGEVIWVDNFSKTINYKGNPADFVMTIDISDKIKAENNLKYSEEKYRLISENTDDLIAVYNIDGIVEYLNAETHSRVLGYKSEKFLEKSFRDALVHEDDKKITDKSGREGLNKGNFPYQFRLKHQNGIYLWFEVTGKSFTDNYGNRKILCVSRNIDEKRAAEIKIKESEENFRTIAEQAFIGTLIIQDDKVEYVNNALLQIFEYAHKEIDNWNKEDLIKLIYPEDLCYLREHREKLRGGESDTKPYYSYRVFTKYGKIKWIDQFSRPIIYRGKPAELVTIMDISEKKKAEQELMKLNSLKSELLRRTSHELKTPLVSIKGFSELLLTVHKEKLDDYVLATIHEIKLGCERLESLIQDILKTSELESESVELKKSEEDLSFLIKLCVKELQGLIRLRNHEIILEIHNKLITSFEPDQIHLVISNLLNNAIKYTPPNGLIEIKSAIMDDFILISIHDSGIGITYEEKKRLFSQFGKIERYGQGLDIISDGSGLGLFISKKIIELHGGKISVKSRGRNKGSTFSFTLPLIIENKE